jgi:hypothetical protein
MQRTTTVETSMQVILQKGRHAPWKIFPDKLLVLFSEDQGSCRQVPDGSVRDSVAIALAVAFARHGRLSFNGWLSH